MDTRKIADRWSAYSPQILSILRIVAAFLFMQFGAMKLFAFPAGINPQGGTVPLFSEAWFAGVIEVFGGAAVLLGICTRPVAFVMAGEMAVAYFQVHAPRGFWPLLNGGHNAVLYCFLWLFFSAAGSGSWSLDALRKKRQAPPASPTV